MKVCLLIANFPGNFAISKKASSVLWKTKISVSSANSFDTAFLKAFEMSFIQIKNNKGPSTDPWRTPHSTICVDDVTPFTLVNYLQLYK